MIDKRISYVEACAEFIKHKAIQFTGHPLRLLELFGGKGSIYTSYLAKGCVETEGWEINSECAEVFKHSIPNSKFVCCDSVAVLSYGLSSQLATDANIISIDNPLGIYGDYCEHFELLDHVHKLIKSRCLLVFNVVTRPYNPHNNEQWMKRRNLYYDHSPVDLRKCDLLAFYKRKFKQQGLCVCDMSFLHRETRNNSDYFYMLVSSLKPGK